MLDNLIFSLLGMICPPCVNIKKILFFLVKTLIKFDLFPLGITLLFYFNQLFFIFIIDDLLGEINIQYLLLLTKIVIQY